MYVHMYVHAYVCTYVCMYVRTYVCTYVCTCICMYICMYMCMYVHMYVCMYVCTYVCMYVCTYVCMYVCTYVWRVEQDKLTRVSVEMVSFCLLKSRQRPSIALFSLKYMEQSSSCFLRRWICCLLLSSTLLNSSWRLLKHKQQTYSGVRTYMRCTSKRVQHLSFKFPQSSTYMHFVNDILTYTYARRQCCTQNTAHKWTEKITDNGICRVLKHPTTASCWLVHKQRLQHEFPCIATQKSTAAWPTYIRQCCTWG